MPPLSSRLQQAIRAFGDNSAPTKANVRAPTALVGKCTACATDRSLNLQVAPILSKVDALALKVAGPYKDAAEKLLAKAVEPGLRANHAVDCAQVSDAIKKRLPDLATSVNDQGEPAS